MKGLKEFARMILIIALALLGMTAIPFLIAVYPMPTFTVIGIFLLIVIVFSVMSKISEKKKTPKN